MDSTTVKQIAEQVYDSIANGVADTTAPVVVERVYGLAGIEAGHGMLVSSTGMFIVFAALAGIAVLIALLPYLMALLAKVLPEAVPAAKKSTPKKTAAGEDEAIAVAIAIANHKAAGK